MIQNKNLACFSAKVNQLTHVHSTFASSIDIISASMMMCRLFDLIVDFMRDISVHDMQLIIIEFAEARCERINQCC